jgi:hypothetical protein
MPTQPFAADSIFAQAHVHIGGNCFRHRPALPVGSREPDDVELTGTPRLQAAAAQTMECPAVAYEDKLANSNARLAHAARKRWLVPPLPSLHLRASDTQLCHLG